MSLLSTAATGLLVVPIDSTLSEDSHFLFIREGATGTLAGFRVESDRSLTTLARSQVCQLVRKGWQRDIFFIV